MSDYKDLTDLEFKIYYFILYWRENKKFYDVPAPTYIAKHTGKSERTVYRALEGLTAKGKI